MTGRLGRAVFWGRVSTAISDTPAGSSPTLAQWDINQVGRVGRLVPLLDVLSPPIKSVSDDSKLECARLAW